MIPTLSQVCSLNSPFRDDLEDYAAGHCRSIEIWLTKLESYLEQSKSSAANIKQLLDDLGMTASVASYQGGLLMSQGEARKVAWESFAKRLDLCCEIGAKTVVVACDTTSPLSQVDVERIQASLLQLAKEVGQRGLRAALEFQAKAAFGNNLQTAAALVQEVGSPHLGICLDVFHFFTGPSKFSDL
ncbi:MAG: sugar phosphate isomerase/epimerase, partial [Planctomycetales bacterium]|nr:sugar phosphate isomerase/epimerase [Planctomycetales bacterium]